ncbi:MAG: hypothetical protein ACRYFS_17905 [Janthinobacterium lividum]
MNHFVERLPWRIAALAGLLVGGISLLTGADLWTSLLRLSVAFVVFGAAGLALRVLLQNAETPPAAQGHHFDQTTPEESPEEPTSSASSNAGDKH